MKKLVLFGDSLFGQVSKSELLLLEEKLENKYDVYNCATGGWNTDDLIKKAPYIALLKPDVLLLSVGTNDAAPWKQVELGVFKKNLPTILNNFQDSRVVFFLPPRVNNKNRYKPIPEQVMKQYYDVAREICNQQSIEYIESWKIFESMIEPTDTFHVEDGVHISDVGYEAVFDSFTEVLR